MYFLRAVMSAAGWLITILGFFSGGAGTGISAQSMEGHFKTPAIGAARNTGPYRYRLEYRFYNRDASGDTLSSVRTEARYTRSLYWGHVWIALDDGDVVCLTLNEDVLLAGDDNKATDLQREVEFRKID